MQHLRVLEELGMSRYRKQGMPKWARDIVREVAYRHKIYVSDLASDNRFHDVVHARTEAMYRIKAAKPEVSSTQLGKWFDRDHTSVLHGIAAHQERAGVPALVHYNLNRSRKRNAAAARFQRLQANPQHSPA